MTRRGAVLAALMMCSSVLLGVEARLAKTDAMLLLTVVAAMGALARVYLSWQRGEDPAHPPWTWPAIFWTAMAGGILLKGPLILMFVGADRRHAGDPRPVGDAGFGGCVRSGA